ncbi:MAG: undecaprenyl/decaprenyl-phosphate alpha-N-acetylglucosaminyl 1-phosphate transferase [Caldiserica bacterium]|jgi:UDP-GlcNAc:undecaprenyl-phosphate GlcNAc-1-phosphate transferase|nr:undecaprenyl/decaprenyl-phosphate alpha-N-acetylglucosaminyl 1-phosphate transferase [Caldisericota bacterium]
MDKLFWAFPVALLTSLVLTPLMRWLAIRFNFYYQPTATSVNRTPIPLLGGVAIYFSFLIAMLFFDQLSIKDISILVSGSILFLVGLVDDVFRISSKGQLFGIFLASSIVVGYGVRIQFLTNPFGTEMLLLEALSIPVSILWIAAITASVKVMDGLDGLAAGICSISALTLFFVAWSNNFLTFGSSTTLVAMLALAGSCIGFLPYNFHPARIFMGEAGVMFIGFILANMTIEGMVKRSSIISLSIPIAALGIPIFNILFAVIRRRLKRKDILSADREHIHDVLLKKGIPHRNAVLVLYAISVLLGVTSFFMSRVSALVTIILWILLVLTLSMGAWKIGLINPRD